jgi:hypothetical protein
MPGKGHGLTFQPAGPLSANPGHLERAAARRLSCEKANSKDGPCHDRRLSGRLPRGTEGARVMSRQVLSVTENKLPAWTGGYSTAAGIFATDISGCASWSSSWAAFCSSPREFVRS